MPIFWQSGDRGKEAGGGKTGWGEGGGWGTWAEWERPAGVGEGRGGTEGVDSVAEPRGVLTAAAGGIRLLTIAPICVPFFSSSLSSLSPPPRHQGHPLLPL